MWILILLLFVSPVMACPAGSEAYNGGCADMQAPATDPPVKPSDELPPSHGGKREAVTIDMPKSETNKDIKADVEKVPQQ